MVRTSFWCLHVPDVQYIQQHLGCVEVELGGGPTCARLPALPGQLDLGTVAQKHPQ